MSVVDNGTARKPPPLGGTKRDIGVSLVKGAVGAIPLAGGVFSEIIGQIIPEQRIQRLETYVRYLNERLDKVNPQKLKDLESINLFEDGALQAARALSDERKAYIAQIVAHGISGDETARIEAKRLLDVFGQIDDAQVIMLMSYHPKYDHDYEFLNKHDGILQGERPLINSTDDARDKWAVREIALDQLIRLGLLQKSYGIEREEPQFDYDTGTLRAVTTEITHLGRLLLRRTGLVE